MNEKKYAHQGDVAYHTIQEESVGDEHLYDNAKNCYELHAGQKTEAELLKEEEQLLEDFFRTITEEFSKFDSALLKQKNKLGSQDYDKFLEEGRQILHSIRDLNHVLGRVRRKKGGYAYTKWDQFAGFNQKVQHEGQKYGLNIDGCGDLEYIDKKNNNFYQVNCFNKVDKSKNLQLVPMGWDRHATFMILDHTNDKIIIYDPNGDFYNLFKEQARLEKIDKDSVMKFLLGKDNAEQLKNYDLCDANGTWKEETGITCLDQYRHLNTGKQNLKAGETDGSCAFSSRHWADTFLKKYFKYIKNNKTKVIKDYRTFLSDLNRKMQNNGLYHAANLRNILKAGLESFYQCDIIKESLSGWNKQSSLHTGLQNHFPKTIAKFQHLIEHFKYREKNSQMHYWEDAVRQTKEEKIAKALEPTRKIMEEGFYETYGNNGLNNNQRLDGCEYLNAMKEDPISYNKKRIPHLGNKTNDADCNDLNTSDLKNHINKNRYKKIISKRRGSLNLDELSNNDKKLNHSII